MNNSGGSLDPGVEFTNNRGSDPLVQLKCFSVTDTHSPHV